ncbi:13964_t:CDS:2, partial [Ambispora leptoticha]
MTRQLLFFVTLNKITEEFTLQEKDLVNLKIPKRIVHISLYPSKLVIKKKKVVSEVDEYDYSEENEDKLIEDNDYEENSLMIYQGDLEPNGENDKEKFYR